MSFGKGLSDLGVSDVIAAFICERIDSGGDGCAELQRTELAARFGCVPSQINYVISTRFSPERGYIVESRRGGGGYIRIRKVRQSQDQLIMYTVNAVGSQINFSLAKALLSNLLDAGAINLQTARLIESALTESTLRAAPPAIRAHLRAAIFKQMLVQALGED